MYGGIVAGLVDTGLPCSRIQTRILPILVWITRILGTSNATNTFLAFLDNVFKLHGLPTSIVSDREIGTQFSLVNFGRHCSSFRAPN